MLARYLERDWPRAGAAERAAFERLLETPDPELYTLLTGAAAPAEPELAQLLARMRADDGAPAVARKVELEAPDGRPLHGYQCTGETFGQLEDTLKQSLVVGASLYGMAREFVFWAAEHIRLRFPGGKLTWKFVFDGLGMSGDHAHALGKRLVERGLREWGREVVKLKRGRMYLYSLMREGGVPESLLQERSSYRKAVMGLVNEIEREGGIGAMPYVQQMANRWAKYLPQTFRDEDFVLLLADFAKDLVYWRGKLPKNLPKGEAQHWLDTNCRGWSARLPLRMTPQVAKTLILPVLEAERSDSSLTLRSVLSRELRCQDDTREWIGYLIFNDAAWLPSQMFPNMQDLKLRLSPTGASYMPVSYQAMFESGGWHLRRFAGARASFQFPPYEEFAFTAYADNRFVGEVVVDSGQPSPDESLSFWRVADESDGADANRLVPLNGKPSTCAKQIWLLGAQGIEPVGEASLDISGPEDALGGRLWRISGRGYIRVGDERYLIETGTEEESPETRLFLTGETLLGWHRSGSVPVYRGAQKIYGIYDSELPKILPDHQIRRTPGRLLCSEVVRWVKEDVMLARIQYICFPANVRFQLQECGPGKVLFNAEGLKNGWVVTLQTADTQVSSSVERERVSLELSTSGAAPGLINLKLYDPSNGKALDLQAIWPAKRAILLDPQGRRLKQNEPVSIDAMNGWRGVVPNGAQGGDLQLRLAGHRPISLPVEGEVSLTTNSQLIRAMLAQGGLDAQVNVSLHVGGIGSKRLEIRRYHDRATVRGDVLQVRLDRDGPEMPVSALASQLRTGCLWLYAVDINSPERIEEQENIATSDIRALLGNEGGPWLIQSRFDERVQRPVVWGSDPHSLLSRDDLIRAYTEEWRRLLSDVQNQKWDVWWELMESVGRGGDMGAIYQAQALAQVPSAAIALALRVPNRAVSAVMELDLAVPIFWPALPVFEFVSALNAERARQAALFESLKGFSDEEIEKLSDEVIVKRIRSILVRRPELTAHFGRAMIETDIIHSAMQLSEWHEALSLCWRPKRETYGHLEQLVQQVVRRCDRMPAGVHCPGPSDSLLKNQFPPHVQPLINAPFTVAKMAMGLLPAPDVDQKLALINLRHVDSAYFDDALPAFLAFLTAEDS